MARFPRISAIFSPRSFALAFGLLTAGCSNVEFLDGDYASLFELARESWTHANAGVSKDAVLSIPYASIGYRVGGGAQNMLLLVGGTSDPLLWTAQARFAIVTVDGRVVRTNGFKHNLGGMQVQTMDVAPDGEVSRRLLADFPDLDLYSVAIVCKAREAGPQTITLLNRPVETVKVSETCRSDAKVLHWIFENTYWRDRTTGDVWRSVQYVHPNLDALEIETLRPVAKSKS